jgi:uncharacterized protein with NRDE domain
MCLVVIAWQKHAEYPVIIAGNRDEFHARPTKEMHWWPDKPDMVRNGRFATVTNFRDAELPVAKLRSRGHLVKDFLETTESPIDFLNNIDGELYAGFNLLVSDGDTLGWLSNRGGSPRALPPGVYGLSNALLDSPWDKVTRSKAAMEKLIQQDKINETELLRLLSDRQKASASEVETGGLPFARAHSISAAFIVLPDYGTRSSSVAFRDRNGNWRLQERRFDASGKSVGDTALGFATSP